MPSPAGEWSSFTSPVLTWTGDLAVGQSAIVSFSVRVNNPDLGDNLMVNAVVSAEIGSTCPQGGHGLACSSIVVVLVPVLDIAVTADRTTTVPGAIVTYTVSIANTGQTDYLGATVTASLAGVVDDAGYAGGATSTAGTVTFSNPNLTWTGNVSVGATVIVTYVVTVADPDVGNHLLATSVTSSAPGSTCGSAAECANSVTVLIPGLAISTSANVATATPGDRVVFTITLVNTGQTPYPDAVVNTVLTGVLDDATFDGLIDASIGVATYTSPNLSWTGTLDVGDSATISYDVIVRNPDPGDRVMSATINTLAPGSTCPGTGAHPACTATVTVLVPSLTIGKSVSTPTTTPGGLVSYTIIITNSGQTPYVGVVIDDSLQGVLSDATYNGDAAAGTGTMTFAASTLTWTGDLLVGASATVRYSITVHDPDTGDKLIVNSVTSTAPGSTCPPGGTLPQCSAQLRVLIPGLVITKTADKALVVAGSVVHYTVTVVNTGQTAYAPAGFSDPLTGVLDDAAYGGDALASTGTVSYSNSTLVWSGALDIGTTATITYSVSTYFPGAGRPHPHQHRPVGHGGRQLHFGHRPALLEHRYRARARPRRHQDGGRQPGGGRRVARLHHYGDEHRTGRLRHRHAHRPADRRPRRCHLQRRRRREHRSPQLRRRHHRLDRRVAPRSDGHHQLLRHRQHRRHRRRHPHQPCRVARGGKHVHDRRCRSPVRNLHIRRGPEHHAYRYHALVHPVRCAPHHGRLYRCGHDDGHHEQHQWLPGDRPTRDGSAQRVITGQQRFHLRRSAERTGNRRPRIPGTLGGQRPDRSPAERAVGAARRRGQQRLSGSDPVRGAGHLFGHVGLHRQRPIARTRRTKETHAYRRTPELISGARPHCRLDGGAACHRRYGRRGRRGGGVAQAPAPQLSIAVDDGHPSAAAGDTLTYAITVRNLGSTPVTGLHVTQSVPSGLTFGSADSAGQATPGTVAWVVDLDATGTATLHTTMSVSATPKELLRLATVACASVSATAPPIVCASDSDLLPAGRQSAATKTTTRSGGHATSGARGWFIGGAIVVVAALAVAVLVLRRRRRRRATVSGAESG